MKKFLVAVFAASICLLGSGLYVCSAPTQGNSFHVGDATNNQDIEIYNGVLRPCTSGGVALGDASYKFSTLRLSGAATLDSTLSVGSSLGVTGGITTAGLIIDTPQTKFVTHAASATTSIVPTSSFIKLTSTENVTMWTRGTAVFSTAAATAGQYMLVTTTCSTSFSFATGANHYILGASSPTVIGQNDTIGAIFNGTYWIITSSSCQ